MYKNVIGLIMAGGQSKRMESNIPKSLMKLNNKPIIWYSFKLLDEIGITEQIVSIPKNKDELYIQAINKIRPNIKCVADCVPQKGNAAGLASALPILNIEHDIIIVIHPDSSCLIKPDIISPSTLFSSTNVCGGGNVSVSIISMSAFLSKHTSRNLSLSRLTCQSFPSRFIDAY